MHRSSSLVVAALAALAVSGCSRPSARPTETEVHGGDPMTSATPPAHGYRCDDHGDRSVGFRNGGLTIVVADPQAGTTYILTAPAQGRRFVGNDISATMEERQLRLTLPDGSRVICTRQAEG